MNLRVRHLVPKPSGYYFQATAAMRAAGIASEPLGTDLAAAATRAGDLNAAWDVIRADAGADAPARGTVDHLVHELRRGTEYADKAPRMILRRGAAPLAAESRGPSSADRRIPAFQGPWSDDRSGRHDPPQHPPASP